MLGACFLLGGLKHHTQEYNRAGARMQAGLLFLATVATAVSVRDLRGCRSPRARNSWPS